MSRSAKSNVIARRLVQAVPVIVLATFIVFVLLKLVPGDVAVTLAGDNASDARVAEIRHLYGLDRPFLLQYGAWLWKALHGDLSTLTDLQRGGADLDRALFPAYAADRGVGDGHGAGDRHSARRRRRQPRGLVARRRHHDHRLARRRRAEFLARHAAGGAVRARPQLAAGHRSCSAQRERPRRTEFMPSCRPARSPPAASPRSRGNCAHRWWKSCRRSRCARFTPKACRRRRSCGGTA